MQAWRPRDVNGCRPVLNPRTDEAGRTGRAVLREDQVADTHDEAARPAGVAALEHIALPVFAALHGYTDLAASGMLPPDVAEHGPGILTAFILRGSEPGWNTGGRDGPQTIPATGVTPSA